MEYWAHFNHFLAKLIADAKLEVKNLQKLVFTILYYLGGYMYKMPAFSFNPESRGSPGIT